LRSRLRIDWCRGIRSRSSLVGDSWSLRRHISPPRGHRHSTLFTAHTYLFTTKSPLPRAHLARHPRAGRGRMGCNVMDFHRRVPYGKMIEDGCRRRRHLYECTDPLHTRDPKSAVPSSPPSSWPPSTPQQSLAIFGASSASRPRRVSCVKSQIGGFSSDEGFRAFVRDSICSAGNRLLA